jgi:teichuronic acid biosynthesis glycosyltransferase TuaC
MSGDHLLKIHLNHFSPIKVLIVCSGNVPDFKFEIHQAFIFDQVNAIQQLEPSIEFDYFFIKGKGLRGYLSNLGELKRKLKTRTFDLVHAHFSLSALLANLQRQTPVVCTFHGSDINDANMRLLSGVVELLSKKTIYVSEALREKALIKPGKKSSVIPCGVWLDVFKPMNREEIRRSKNFDDKSRYILFSSAFDNPVKNYALLDQALHLIPNHNIVVLELKNYSREQVAILMNAVDLCVMTSLTEGSPQFIKEAMATNCPIISTDVGDVKEIIGNTKRCRIVRFDRMMLADAIKSSLIEGVRTNGRDRMTFLDNNIVAKKIKDIYASIGTTG